MSAETDRVSGCGSLEQKRILIVDDSEDMVDMLRVLLDQEGALVSTAESGPEALELLESSETDLIITDISMPEMDGYELLHRIRQRPEFRNVPVIALTGLGEEGDALKRAEEARFSAHVMKPVDFTDLIRIILGLVNRRDPAISA